MIEDNKVGLAQVSSYSANNVGDSVISGIIYNDIVIGDKTIPVTSIAFSVPNFYEIHGQAVEVERDETTWHCANRLLLEDNEYVITIDKKSNYKELYKSLNESGGYIFLYDGCITKKSGEAISHEELFDYAKGSDVLGALARFLTFLNGRRTAPCIVRGIYENKVVWTDYTPFYPPMPNSPNAFRWGHHFLIDGFSELWRNFFALWKADRDFLEFAIHWLVESNLGNGAYVETSIVQIQNAL